MDRNSAPPSLSVMLCCGEWRAECDRRARLLGVLPARVAGLRGAGALYIPAASFVWDGTSPGAKPRFWGLVGQRDPGGGGRGDGTLLFPFPVCGRGQRRDTWGQLNAGGVSGCVTQLCAPLGFVGQPRPSKSPLPAPPSCLLRLGAPPFPRPAPRSSPQPGAAMGPPQPRWEVKRMGVLMQDRPREGPNPLKARWTVTLPTASNATATSTVPPVCAVQRIVVSHACNRREGGEWSG